MDRIDEKYKSVIKLKIVEEVNTLRLIHSTTKNIDIEDRFVGNVVLINDQHILSLLQCLVKQEEII